MPNMKILLFITFVGALLIGTAMMTAFAQGKPDASVTDAPSVVLDGPTPLWAADDPADVAKDDPAGYAKELWNAIKGGDYFYAICMVLVLFTAGFRFFIRVRDKDGDGKDDEPHSWHGKIRHWFNSTDEGGVASTGIISLLATISLAGLAHQPFSLGLLKVSVVAAVGAMGGFAVLFKFVLPLATKLWKRVAG